MYNLHPFEGKTIRSIDHRQGGEQVIIFFTDESFLIISADAHLRETGSGNFGQTTTELTFQGRDYGN